ncbi:[F-actin]-monooxygenase MICAL3 [Chionoecetes opilio]|uniref:[F-actin]-monooxygenase MICAL3 n=1 Tax=Chionoecetes opilio TaxID=41210 RepID=A0A8J5CGU7_CHIOP|nr:[F-actin]-monooxygenase MICAL3 [Chionoecetes opilio]
MKQSCRLYIPNALFILKSDQPQSYNFCFYGVTNLRLLLNCDKTFVMSMTLLLVAGMSCEWQSSLAYAVVINISATLESAASNHTLTPEESLSEDEAGTPSGTLERGTQAPGSGSSGRKQRTAAFKAARQAELKRLRMAQEIQRQLEECEVKTRELEERGVAVEKALRGEAGGSEHDEGDLMGDWFGMVHEKNALVRWEQELMVRAKELELEDRHVRLEHELRHRMAISEHEKSFSPVTVLVIVSCCVSEHEKSREDIDREGTILAEMLSILEQKDALVTMLEEDRLRCLTHYTPSMNTPYTTTTPSTHPLCFHPPSMNTPYTTTTPSLNPPYTTTNAITTHPLCFYPHSISHSSPIPSHYPIRPLTSDLSTDLTQAHSIPHSSPIPSHYPTRPLTSHDLNADLTQVLEGLTHTHDPTLASLQQCISHFTGAPRTRRPSIFDRDPFSSTHHPSHHVKPSLYSHLGQVRRMTLPDLTRYMTYKSYDHPYRRFSLSNPLSMDVNKGRLRPSHSLSNLSEEEGSGGTVYHPAYGCVVVVVVSLWLLPFFAALLSLLSWDTPAGSLF